MWIHSETRTSSLEKQTKAIKDQGRKQVKALKILEPEKQDPESTFYSIS